MLKKCFKKCAFLDIIFRFFFKKLTDISNINTNFLILFTLMNINSFITEYYFPFVDNLK